MMKLFFSILCLLLTIFSYGFVDPNFPLKPPQILHNLVYKQRFLATLIFVVFIFAFFGIYFSLLDKVKKKKITDKQIWQLIFLVVVILLFSFPAFSHDIFNYMATAKTTFFYRENPYLVMPIEFVGEPMLKFMHAANKFALYGPFWILLTFFPHFLGRGNILLTVFTFKAFAALFYLGLCWLIWKISGRNKYSLVFFSFNPLVMFETLVSGHNDVVMMTFALLSFYLLFQKKFRTRAMRGLSFFSLFASIGIKFATVILTPLFVFSSRIKKEKLISLSAWAMFFVFLFSPLREEIYSWYFIWVISFVALVPGNRFLRQLTLAFSFSLLLRYTPFLYTRNWGGITPTIKFLTTFIPPGLVLLAKTPQCLKK